MWNIIVITVDLMNYCTKDKPSLVNLVSLKIQVYTDTTCMHLLIDCLTNSNGFVLSLNMACRSKVLQGIYVQDNKGVLISFAQLELL